MQALQIAAGRRDVMKSLTSCGQFIGNSIATCFAPSIAQDIVADRRAAARHGRVGARAAAPEAEATPRAISAELAVRGHLAGSGKPFEPSVVVRMLRG